MTITVNTIEGRKGSACNNDAFAVLANGADVLDIIPAQILPGKTRDDIRTAFAQAAQTAGSSRQIIRAARHALGLTPA